MPDGSASCWPHAAVRPGALAQRAALLDAVWAGACRTAGCAGLPEELLPPLPPPHGERIDYAATLALSPDGVWRVARDHVGAHPGAALLEAPLLAVFLPDWCRALFGRSLLLPSLPVFWLGDPATRAMLASTPDRFRLRDGLDPEDAPVALCGLSPEARRALQSRVDRAPARWVAELNFGLLPTSRTVPDQPSSATRWPAAAKRIVN